MDEVIITPRKQWIVVGILAGILHLIFFTVPWQALLPERSELTLPSPVKIHEIDPSRLAEIREQWDKQKPKQLLLKQSDSKPDENVPRSKDARYFSDRNTDVEKEMRAKKTATLPRPGAASQPQPRSEARAKGKSVPKLSDLGIAIAKNAPKQRAAALERQAPQVSEGGDQWIDDPTLAEGAQNVLKTEQYVYYSYFSRLYEAIAPVWTDRIRNIVYPKRIVPGEYTSKVDVVFDREGELVDIRFFDESGIPEFDSAIVYAWRKIQRFPNPPKALLDKHRRIHTGWTFRVQVSDSAQFQYSAPMREY